MNLSTAQLSQVTKDLEKFRVAYRELNLEWIRKYFRVEKKDTEQVNAPETCVEAGGEVFFVLEEDVVVGVCALYKTGVNEYELAKMAVRPSHQGRKLGDLMMVEMEQWARAKGADEIHILSNTKLEPAIRLYHKHGFVTVNLGAHPDYERCNIFLKKSLAAPV